MYTMEDKRKDVLGTMCPAYTTFRIGPNRDMRKFFSRAAIAVIDIRIRPQLSHGSDPRVGDETADPNPSQSAIGGSVALAPTREPSTRRHAAKRPQWPASDAMIATSFSQLEAFTR